MNPEANSSSAPARVWFEVKMTIACLYRFASLLPIAVAGSLRRPWCCCVGMRLGGLRREYFQDREDGIRPPPLRLWKRGLHFGGTPRITRGQYHGYWR